MPSASIAAESNAALKSSYSWLLVAVVATFRIRRKSFPMSPVLEVVSTEVEADRLGCRCLWPTQIAEKR